VDLKEMKLLASIVLLAVTVFALSESNIIWITPKPQPLITPPVQPLIIPALTSAFCDHNFNCFDQRQCYQQTASNWCGGDGTRRDTTTRTDQTITTQRTYKVPAQYKPVYAAPVPTPITICPVSYIMNKDSGHEVCVLRVECDADFEWRGNVCAKKDETCPLDFVWNGDECVAKIICPPTYIVQGNHCVASTPVCQTNWEWDANRHVCVSIKMICQQHYKLRGDGKCEADLVKCPPGYYKSNDVCLPGLPKCMPGYTLNINNVCSKPNLSCPSGSQQQNNRCISYEWWCPKGELDKADMMCVISDTQVIP